MNQASPKRTLFFRELVSSQEYIVLDFTARMEAEFMLLVRQTRSELVEHHFKRPSSYTFINNVKVYGEELDLFYQLDDPNNISMSPRIDPSHGQLILARLLDVIQRQIKTGELETPDDWQAQVNIRYTLLISWANCCCSFRKSFWLESFMKLDVTTKL